jgi:hypothetical protein
MMAGYSWFGAAMADMGDRDAFRNFERIIIFVQKPCL